MRLAIDARELEGKRTGVGRYLAGLLRGLAEVAPEIDLTLYTRAPLPEELPGRHIALPAGSGTIWQELYLPRALARRPPDLFLGPGYSVPPTVVPSIVVLHDLSFERYPEAFPAKERWRRRVLARLGAARASRILCDTKTVAEEIRYVYRPSAPVTAISPGINADAFACPPRRSVPGTIAAGRLSRPIVATSGSIFNRRFPETLMKGAARFFDRIGSGTLVIAGENRTSPRLDLVSMGRDCMGDRLHLLGYVSEVTLRELLCSADLFVWLSRYEGFGFPPLEAMAAGLPVVAGGCDCLRETLEGAALLLPDVSADALEQALLHLLRDDEERKRRIRAGKQLVAKLSFSRCGARTASLLRKMIL